MQPRRRDLALITRGELAPSSNYCFGEGGAGTYSDGKLYARAKDRAGVAEVIADLVRFGAPAGDRGRGAPARRLEPAAARAGRAARAPRPGSASRTASRPRPPASTSRRGACARCASTAARSRPTSWCWRSGTRRAPSTPGRRRPGIAVARKPIAVGVRIEHPQPLIDRIQYGAAAGHPKLPPAFYELTASAGERGVYSFCMCPGGWIVPAATEPDGVVVNGMSLSRRDSPFANSGLVVSVAAEDFGPAGAGPLAGVEFQRAIERAAFRAGGGGSARRRSGWATSWPGGRATRSAPPATARAWRRPTSPRCCRRSSPRRCGRGCARSARACRRSCCPEALLIAAETRTSAPVRFLRDPETLVSPSVAGLYPCGEGAGYAGRDRQRRARRRPRRRADPRRWAEVAP